jgi:uncharacterized protein (DUF1330 family)
MAAYFVAQYTVNDPAKYGEYAQGAGPTVAAHGGEVLSFDVSAETMEGTPPGPQTVIIKFDSAEAAKTWYNSPEYQAVVNIRLSCTDGFAVLSESMRAG